MTKTYYVVSINTSETMTTNSKTISLSEHDPKNGENGGSTPFMGVITLTLDDPLEFDRYQVGTAVTLTLEPVAA